MSSPSSDESVDPPGTGRVLAVVALALFSTSLFMRAIDPVIPQIAAGFQMDVRTVALLSTAYALPYALAQPVLGSLGDTVGKVLVLKLCLVLSIFAGFLGAFAPDFWTLFGSRVLVGMVSGGIFPIALAIGGDLVPVAKRQVAFSRLLAAAMLGNVLGSPLAGLIADTVGWRGVFALVAAIAVVALVAVQVGFRGMAIDVRTRFEMTTIVRGYRAVFRNPLAKICFLAVFLEGTFLHGLFPFVAALLAERGEGRAAIAGVVIAGFAVGGFVYSGLISVLLRRLGERGLMRGGGALMAIGLAVVTLGFVWPVEFMIFMVIGLGFYSLHGVIQIYVTELAPSARGTAVAMHGCSFFLGQALGPVVYRTGFDHLGVSATSTLAGLVLFVTGLMCAAFLRRPAKPEPAAARDA